MEEIITSLNETLDIEKLNYRTFSQSGIFMAAGLKRLQMKYTRVLFIFHYIEFSFGKKLYDDLKTFIRVFSDAKQMYMVIPLTIPGDNNIGHANVLFFYKHKGIVYCERYDPQYSCCIQVVYHMLIDDDIREVLTKLNIKYISPKDMTLIVCPQAYIRDNFGYCQTYTLIYLDKLLSNLSRHRLQIISDFPTENDLKNYIKDIVKILLKLPILTKYDRNILLNYDTSSKNLRNYITSLLFLSIF